VVNNFDDRTVINNACGVTKKPEAAVISGKVTGNVLLYFENRNLLLIQFSPAIAPVPKSAQSKTVAVPGFRRTFEGQKT